MGRFASLGPRVAIAVAVPLGLLFACCCGTGIWAATIPQVRAHVRRIDRDGSATVVFENEGFQQGGSSCARLLMWCIRDPRGERNYHDWYDQGMMFRWRVEGYPHRGAITDHTEESVTDRFCSGPIAGHTSKAVQVHFAPRRMLGADCLYGLVETEGQVGYWYDEDLRRRHAEER